MRIRDCPWYVRSIACSISLRSVISIPPRRAWLCVQRSAFNGKEIGGLDVAIPETPTNTYGGISRAEHDIWKTQAFDISTDFPDIGTTVDSTTIKGIYDRAMGEMTRGRQAPDIIFASPKHWEAYSAATVAIQRIARNDGALGRLGFRTLEYVGPGGNAEIVWGGGKGSQMPDDTSFFIKSDTFRMRYNENRNFSTLFDGDGQKPINQDAIVQFVGFMGEITMTNPAFNGRLFNGS